MRLSTPLAPLAAGLLALGTAQAATATTDGALFTLVIDADVVALSAAGTASMTEDGAVFLPVAAADGLGPNQGLMGSYAGAGVTFSSGGVDVALTDLVVTDAGEMTGMITATGIEGVNGLVMYGRMALFDLSDGDGGMNLRLDTMAGGILADLLDVDLGGGVVARLSAAPTATPLPGALLFFATGAGALALRRRR